MSRRVCAIIGLVCVGVLGLAVAAFLIRGGVHILIGLAGFAVSVAGAWWVVTERGPRRITGAIALILGLVLIAVALAQVLSGTEAIIIRLLVAMAVLAVATGCTRYALIPDLHALDQTREGRPPSRPVLICNPKSGDGKVERFGIISAAAELGVETIVLGPDDDLEQLARDAVARGADCLGMAGGDGSQALVASIAIEHDVPFVCVSAGTRNHFALDLGLDRDDPRRTLTAFRDAVERRVDYATVNGRLFVNNVSLGVYATIVQQDSYRAEKAQTAAAMLPDLLGPMAEPFDLQFTTPAGDAVDGSFMILVSNNPYAATASPDAGIRRRMDTGTLGVIAVSTSTGAEAAQLMALSALGLRKASPFWHEFTAVEFEIRSRSGRAFAGVDGEALDLPTPMRFRSHPAGLRLLVPADNEAVAARRRARDVSLRALVDVATGRTPQL
ncbi:diacylglycerol/lipid kinase family protein [Gordonia insulae]|uniref:Lipid kinase YegS n=1 Tax=Gordonia insulae TaxID=2420509 RepID=A0A3G8JU33_9ACTN|nr:diacylglycerol kinase family protein [Gordonia insulae]AZG48671.1 lipid kinase YegS [Gordonia insulae]